MMFKEAIQSIVKELDPQGDLKSVSSAYDSRKIDVLTVVKIVKTSKLWFFTKVEYHPTPVRLPDLFLSGDAVDFGESSQQDVATVAMKGSAEAMGHFMSKPSKLLGNIEASCSWGRSTAVQSKLESVSVDYTKLHKAMQARKFDNSHPVIKALMNSSKVMGLGVIYDVLKTKNPLYLKRNSQTLGSAKFSIQEIAATDNNLKVEGMKILNLDAGCVLGFKVLDIPLELVNEKKKVPADSLCHDGVREFTEECLARSISFSELKQKVEDGFQDFSTMGLDVKMFIWTTLSKILRCPQTLHVLDCILEEGFLSADDSLDLDREPQLLLPELRELLSALGLDPDMQCDDSFFSSLNLLVSSLTEIDEEGVTLITTLDQEVRMQVLSTVEQLLDNIFEKTEGEAWSSLFGGSSTNKAKNVLEASGLMLDEKNPYPALGKPGVPNMALMSLYVVLKGLSLLTMP